MLINFESTTTQPIFENPSLEKRVEPKIKEKLGQNEINTATKNDTFENLAREKISDFENEPRVEKDTSDTSDLNQVDLPKYTTKNINKEANNEIYIILTLITFALLLFLLMVIILLTLFCKEIKKKESFPLQEMGESE